LFHSSHFRLEFHAERVNYIVDDSALPEAKITGIIGCTVRTRERVVLFYCVGNCVVVRVVLRARIWSGARAAVYSICRAAVAPPEKLGYNVPALCGICDGQLGQLGEISRLGVGNENVGDNTVAFISNGIGSCYEVAYD
jgi:hypothetical protein